MASCGRIFSAIAATAENPMNEVIFGNLLYVPRTNVEAIPVTLAAPVYGRVPAIDPSSPAAALSQALNTQWSRAATSAWQKSRSLPLECEVLQPIEQAVGKSAPGRVEAGLRGRSLFLVH
jgi:hypothetical protein